VNVEGLPLGAASSPRTAKGLSPRRFPQRSSSCGKVVEILWDAAIDRDFRRAVCLKGFEDGRNRICGAGASPAYQGFGWTEFAPLRRNCDSVFENLVERASRERADSGASPKRSHKMGCGVFVRKFT
jgi:hypothetical protein